MSHIIEHINWEYNLFRTVQSGRTSQQNLPVCPLQKRDEEFSRGRLAALHVVRLINNNNLSETTHV